jgi:hypothetical protein
LLMMEAHGCYGECMNGLGLDIETTMSKSKSMLRKKVTVRIQGCCELGIECIDGRQ